MGKLLFEVYNSHGHFCFAVPQSEAIFWWRAGYTILTVLAKRNT